MALSQIHGHDELLRRLQDSLAAGRFPQVALLTGPPGVGKQRIALWLAQALLCETDQAPCGTCADCRQVLELTHPDVHWFVPVARLKATEMDKQIAEVEESLAEALGQRRASGHWTPPDGAISHPLASIRLLQRRVALTPFRSRRKVVILGDAERLVVQEATQVAANALLKVLEEPPADTVLLLTAAEPQALLPTVRSRAVPLRVPRVGDEAVRGWLAREQPNLPTADREALVVRAEGAIGRLLSGWDHERNRRTDVDGLLAAVKRGPAGWAARALQQAPWDARGGHTALLDALGTRARAGLRDRATRGDLAGTARMTRLVRRVEVARAEAQGNRNPQLGLAVLLGDMEKLS